MTEIKIQDEWQVERYVRDRVDVGDEFTTTDAYIILLVNNNLLNYRSSIAHTLKKMNCVETLHIGVQGGGEKTRDPNRYQKIADPGDICKPCRVKSCILRNPEMAEQFRLSENI